MSVYSSGSASYQDTVKWLVGFVPVGAIIAAGAVVGPELIDAAQEADSLGAYLADQGWALLGLAFVIVGIGVVLWSGAAILGAQPQSLADIIATTNTDTGLEQAFGAGVAAPYYFDVEVFKADLRTLATNPKNLDPDVAAHATATVDVLREWALHRELGTAYGRFRLLFGVGLALAVAGFLVSALFVDDAAPAAPIRAMVVGAEEAMQDLTAATGCSGINAQYWLVDGSWEAPVLEVDGDGCRLGARWKPDLELVRVRPASSVAD